jgi:Lar family restriction alleviation protein
MSKGVTKRYIHFCPHCGANAVLRQSEADGYWYVACADVTCGCRSKSWHKAADAIDAWNRRLE